MSASDITIREATPNDIESLIAFQQAMAQETECKTLEPELIREGVRTVFDSPDKGFYLIAEVDGNVAGGLLMTYEWSDWRNATFWWIQSVYVDPRWRRRGVYRAMHDYVYGIARSRDDICGIRLYVERENHIAQQAYASLGMSKSHYDLFEIDFVL